MCGMEYGVRSVTCDVPGAGGMMIIPVGQESQQMVLVKKKLDGTFTKEGLIGVRYVPLTSVDEQLGRRGLISDSDL